jgi:hypothetical protein
VKYNASVAICSGGQDHRCQAGRLDQHYLSINDLAIFTRMFDNDLWARPTGFTDSVPIQAREVCRQDSIDMRVDFISIL